MYAQQPNQGQGMCVHMYMYNVCHVYAYYVEIKETLWSDPN